ncbi:MAG: superinfection immunity protein [Robiginitomaculum sp.]|nr:MAG: superinfection immunity protein [Robiginitomaculum sp.]
MDFGLLPLLFYFLPWLIALVRGHHSTTAIFFLTFLLGWTGLFWLIAFVWSLTHVRRRYYR